MATKDILMDGDKMCIAWFKKIIKKYILTTKVEPPEGGTVTGAGTYDEGTTVQVEAIPNEGYEFDHWDNETLKIGMVLYSSQANYVDMLLANSINELRIDIPDYQNTTWLDNSKAALPDIIAKGAKIIWGVSSNSYNNADYTITLENWPIFRQAILDNAQWAQDNGVYEFQIGNEEEFHCDRWNPDATIKIPQLINNLKAVATEVKQIFTNGKVSYSCAHDYINDWVSAGKGDIDILASNIYKGGEGNYSQTVWKTEVDALVNGFGVDGTSITEFNLSWSDINNYNTDETQQAIEVTEMIDYIRTSGIRRAFWYALINDQFGAIKADGTYRLLWNSLIG